MRKTNTKKSQPSVEERKDFISSLAVSIFIGASQGESVCVCACVRARGERHKSEPKSCRDSGNAAIGDDGKNVRENR